jgi:hypothetical protein
MTASATVLNIWCLRHSTGTDFGVNQALAGLAPSIAVAELGGTPLQDFLKSLPGVIGAIDSARSDPDNLYLTTDTAGGLGNSIWPTDRPTLDIQADQSVSPGIQVPVAFSQSLSLWDFDTISADDLLGSITFFESEQGAGELAKLAKSDVESSYYFVTYRVD